jgi:hypothetical protein
MAGQSTATWCVGDGTVKWRQRADGIPAWAGDDAGFGAGMPAEVRAEHELAILNCSGVVHILGHGGGGGGEARRHGFLGNHVFEGRLHLDRVARQWCFIQFLSILPFVLLFFSDQRDHGCATVKRCCGLVRICLVKSNTGWAHGGLQIDGGTASWWILI